MCGCRFPMVSSTATFHWLRRTTIGRTTFPEIVLPAYLFDWLLSATLGALSLRRARDRFRAPCTSSHLPLVIRVGRGSLAPSNKRWSVSLFRGWGRVRALKYRSVGLGLGLSALRAGSRAASVTPRIVGLVLRSVAAAAVEDQRRRVVAGREAPRLVLGPAWARATPVACP